jgi:hypothetical protein
LDKKGNIMLINGKLAKLGKKVPRLDSRTLRLAKYIKKLSPPPVEVSWITKLAAAEALPMYLNDELGDCVAAAAGHMEQQWNFYAAHPYQPTDQEILTSYEIVGGYAPGNPSTDNGMDMLSYLNWWRSSGLGGHKIGAFLAVNWLDLNEVRIAIQLFGSVYQGVQLPVTAQGETAWTVSQGGIYSSNGQPGSWGGHCIPLVASSAITHTCVTWGSTLKMSHNFLEDYGDEAYAVLSQDWINSTGSAPNGFDYAQLQTDLSQL